MNEAAEVVTSAADSNANVIFGAVIDEAVGEEIRVTVIATGFGTRQPRRRRQEAVVAPTGAPPIPTREPEAPSDTELEIPSFLRED